MRQLLHSLVRTVARCVMNSMSTLLSVLQVVNAIQTSPSDEIAVMMFIF